MTASQGRMVVTFRAEGRPGASRQCVVAAFVLVLALAFAAGVGGGRSLAHVGGPGRIVSTRSYGGDLLVVMLAVLAVGLGLLAYAARPRRRKHEDEPEFVLEPQTDSLWKAWLVVAAVLLLVLGAAAAFLLLSHSQSTVPLPPPRGAPAAGAAPSIPPATRGASMPPVHWWGLAVVGALLVAGAACLWWLRRRGRDDADIGEPRATDDLRTAVDLSLDDLEQEPDPRRAVIRAYARMEAALGLHGLGRRPFETPLEYLARTLVSRRVSRRATTRLTDLFGRAKFSQHDVDATMKRDALASLAEIRDELTEGER